MGLVKFDNPVELAWGEGSRLVEVDDRIALITPYLRDDAGQVSLELRIVHWFKSERAAMAEAAEVIEWKLGFIL